MRCANEKCNKDPDRSIYAICVTCDGDFVCDDKCKVEYERQKNKFFNETVNSKNLTNAYLMGAE